MICVEKSGYFFNFFSATKARRHKDSQKSKFMNLLQIFANSPELWDLGTLELWNPGTIEQYSS
jgi:hypothetical protein